VVALAQPPPNADYLQEMKAMQLQLASQMQMMQDMFTTKFKKLK